MSTNFFSLSGELRNKIYEQLVVCEDPIDPWAYYDQEELTPGLLRVSKIIYHEVSSLLYGQNHFDFTKCNSDHIILFLEQIGGNNANYIQHIRLNFPTFLYLDRHDVALEDDSVRVLAKIQSDCGKLSTLTTSLYSTNAMELKLDALDNPNVVTEALALVDTCFRAISSLKEIVVTVYEDGPSGHVRREMKSRGWTIIAMELEEQDSEIPFSDIEDYDDDASHGFDDDDEYDIDNDSDFWRRAAED